MTDHPTLWGRLVALIEGEVAADTLEAYRRAGLMVFDLLKQVEERRLDSKLQGLSPWAVPPAIQAELLCAWNAFALQTLGDEFLDADYRTSPATIGYVPPVTAQQILSLYNQVEAWVSRARQAASNPEYRLDVAVPADLPPWSEADPCPRAHLEAMLAAGKSLRRQAEAALATFEQGVIPSDKQAGVARLRQLLADANSGMEYGDRLWTSSPPQELHEQIERQVKRALEGYYRLGQLLAMPTLPEQTSVEPHAVGRTNPGAVRATRPGPGTPGFDPWCLTDQESRAQWKQDPQARKAIQALWANDPDPQHTLAIQREIEAALARRDVAYATAARRRRIGFYYCCPWSSVYVVKRPVTIDGQRLRALQQFTFDVSAEEMGEGGEFKRKVLVGSFQPTKEVDYCDPTAGGTSPA